MTPGQHQHFARQRLIPRPLGHPPRQHRIEQRRTRSGQVEAPLMPVAHVQLTPQHGLGLFQVAALVAEALLAEVVGDAGRSDEVQPRRQLIRIAGQIAERDTEGIAAQRAAPQLAGMAHRVQHDELGIGVRRPVGFRPAGQMHREPLLGHGVAIFQPGVAHRTRRNTGPFRQPPRHPVGIRAALAHPQPDMFASALQGKRNFLADLEILRDSAQPAR